MYIYTFRINRPPGLAGSYSGRICGTFVAITVTTASTVTACALVLGVSFTDGDICGFSADAAVDILYRRR